jgi:isopenicillin-N epimerase
VHSCTGVKTPVRRIADVVQRVNAKRGPDDRILLCVDGVHGFGVEDTPVAELGCDFFAAGCHKWILGPRGTGLLWGRAELFPKLRPAIPSFGFEAYGAWMRGEAPPPTSPAMMTPGGFHSFEHRWALGEAFAFHAAIGKEKIASRIRALNRQCKEGLSKMSHVTLHTPIDEAVSAGIVCFEVQGMEPKAVVARLRDKRIIGTQTPYQPSYARLSFGLMSSPSDVDTALAAINDMASA